MSPENKLLVLCALAAACGGATTKREPTIPPTPAAVVEQVKGAVEQWRQAQEVRSLETIATLYGQTPDLVTVAQGRVTVGWPAVEDELRSFFAGHPEVKVRLSELSITALGPDGAVASGAITRRYGDGVTTIEENGGLTLVFRRTKEGWKIVAQHYSYAPSAS